MKEEARGRAWKTWRKKGSASQGPKAVNQMREKDRGLREQGLRKVVIGRQGPYRKKVREFVDSGNRREWPAWSQRAVTT